MYFVIYIPLYLLSLLPMKVLYLLSDVVSFFLFRVFGYRRKVIAGNLLKAFSEKSDAERNEIARKFHRNFTDTFIETVKSFSASKNFYKDRCTVDLTVADELAEKNVAFQMHAGHQFNWEWINLVWSINCKQPLVGIYMPISNKHIEKIFFKMRSTYGTVMLPATDIKNALLAWKNKPHCLVLVADQKPGDPEHSHWLNFFETATCFVTGPEKNARAKKCPVVFGSAKKSGRGRYHAQLKLACDDASLLAPGALTLMYRDFIEDAVKAQPELYLWSHKRFKHSWKNEYENLWIDNSPAPLI